MKKAMFASGLVVVFSGCVPADPIISDFNGDSVKMQTSQFASIEDTKAATQAEATRICKQGGKSRAEYASTRTLPDYMSEHLYLCL